MNLSKKFDFITVAEETLRKKEKIKKNWVVKPTQHIVFTSKGLPSFFHPAIPKQNYTETSSA